MATPNARPTAPPSAPDLHTGLRLVRAEFERRAEARPDLKVVELVEGVVHVAPPATVNHGEPHAILAAWLGLYSAATPGVHGVNSATVRLDGHNVLQPDVALFLDPGAGCQVRISTDGFIEGAPELVAEVTDGTASLDLGEKLAVYRRNRAREYLVWRPPERRFDWFEWIRGGYRPRPPDAAGIIRSAVFPGLWLDVDALLRDDYSAVLRTLDDALAHPGHAAFTARLRGLQA